MVTFYRRLPRFDYVKPQALEEVLDMLAEAPPGHLKLYAGGTDVIPKLRARMIKAPDVLVDLKGVPGLDSIEYDEDQGMKIGALASIFSVAHSTVVSQKYPVLSQAARSMGSVQVQQRGTIIGNICSALPSADSAPALLCLGAKAVCVKKGGERELDLNRFFKGPGETLLESGELVREIRIPPLPSGNTGVYIKLSTRSRMELALVGVATVASVKNGSFGDVRIGLGAVAPTPMRALKAEAALRGKKVSDHAIGEAARTASEESRPIDDHRGSAEYRRMMVKVLVKRSLRQALSK